MNNTSDCDTTDIIPGQFVAGQMLAQQREKLGLDIQGCADALKISPSKVSALEKGDESPFISDVFIRGYLKNYAKLVELPVNEILDIYDSQKQQCGAHENSPAQHTRPKKTAWWLPYLMGAVIVGGWFFVTRISGFQQGLSSYDEEKASVIETVSTPVTPIENDTGQRSAVEPPAQMTKPEPTHDTISQHIMPVPDLERLNVDNRPNDDLTVALSAQQDLTPVNQNHQITENNHQENRADDHLSFFFSESCWLQVTDANEKTMISSIQNPGTERTVSGQAPFSIVIGNVNGTSLTFNGKPVPLKKSGNGRTLRLNVGN